MAFPEKHLKTIATRCSIFSLKFTKKTIRGGGRERKEVERDGRRGKGREGEGRGGSLLVLLIKDMALVIVTAANYCFNMLTVTTPPY